MKYGSSTARGKVRSTNQDSFAVLKGRDGLWWLFAVADGMGGIQHGDLASRIAVQTLEKCVSECIASREEHPSFSELLQTAFRQVNQNIYEESLRRKLLTGMGTTLSVAILSENTLHTAHVGDSRIYLKQGEEFRCLTNDHSYVKELLDKKMIRPEEVRSHPRRHIVTRAMGLEKSVQPDMDCWTVGIGDTVLFCTDGLNGVMEDAMILDILLHHKEPVITAKTLTNKANMLGGPDNITVIVVVL